MAKLGNLSIRLGLDVSTFTSRLRRSEAELAKSKKRMTKSLRSIGNLGNLGNVVGAVGAGGVFSSIVREAGDFQSAMQGVQSIAQTTKEKFEELREQALDLSGAFLPKDIADAQEILLRNGLKVPEIIDGAVESTIGLSKALKGEVGLVADFSTDIIGQFGKQVQDLQQVNNLLAGAAVQSKFGLSDLQEAFAQGGAVAGSRIELEEFLGVLSATASMFKSGSDAGTSFKTFMSRLAPVTKAADDIFKKYKFSAHDLDGKLLDTAEIVGRLRDSFGSLSDKEQSLALGSAFGSDAIRTAQGLIKLTKEDFQDLMAEIGKGDAVKMGEIRFRGWNAQMKSLNAQMSVLKIRIGETGLLDQLTSGLSKLTSAVGAISKIDPALLKAATVALGGLAVALIGLTGIGFIAQSFLSISAAAGVLGAALGGVISLPVVATIAAIGVGLYALRDPLAAGATKVREWWDSWKGGEEAKADLLQLEQGFSGLKERLSATGVEIKAVMQGLFSSFSEGFGGGENAIGTGLKEGFHSFFDGATQGATQVVSALSEMVEFLNTIAVPAMGFFSNQMALDFGQLTREALDSVRQIEAEGGLLPSKLSGLGSRAVSNILAEFEHLRFSLLAVLNEMGLGVVAWGERQAEQMRASSERAVANMVVKYEGLRGKILSAFANVTDGVIQWGSNLAEQMRVVGARSVANVVSEFKRMKGLLLAVVVNAGVAIKEAFLSINLRSAGAKLAQDITSGLKSGVQSKLGQMRSVFQKFAKDGVSAYKKEIDSASPSKVYMKIGNDIVDGLGIGVKAKEAMLVGKMQENVRAILNVTRQLPEGVRGQYEAALGQVGANLKVGNVDGMSAALEGLKTRSAEGLVGIKQTKEGARELAGVLSDGLFATLERGKDGFKDWASSLIASIGRVIIKQTLLNAILGKTEGGASQGGLFSGILSGLGSLAGLSRGGSRAHGGSVSAGNSYEVGERGPELFQPDRSGVIIPNNALGSGEMKKQYVSQDTITIMPGVTKTELSQFIQEKDRYDRERERRMMEEGGFFA